MRIYLHLTPNKEKVPFNYQQSLVGTFHRWLGENELHDGLSLYSLSWLSHGQKRNDGLDFPNGSTFYVSAASDDLLSNLVKGVFKGVNIRWGMGVKSVTIQRTPDFGEKQIFKVQSPVLIKRREGDRNQFYFFDDDKSGELLTETLKRKMERAGITGDVRVAFDRGYPFPKTKVATYNNIDNKGSICPVIVEGDSQAVQFAWKVGIGNSTGIGFGALI